jgi:hypothetical protein
MAGESVEEAADAIAIGVRITASPEDFEPEDIMTEAFQREQILECAGPYAATLRVLRKEATAEDDFDGGGFRKDERRSREQDQGSKGSRV